MDKSRSQLLFDVGPAKELSSKILISTVYLLSKEINSTSFLFVSLSFQVRAPQSFDWPDEMVWNIGGICLFLTP